MRKRIVLNEEAIALVERAIADGILIQRSWQDKKCTCLLGLIVGCASTVSGIPESRCMERGLSYMVIDRIVSEFDYLRPEEVNPYARRFAMVASKPKNYDLAYEKVKNTKQLILHALEEQL